MNTIRCHVSHRKHSDGITVCAQRPLVGLHTWTDDSIGNGVYYACGDIGEYGTVWERLDATIVEYIDNDTIRQLLDVWCRDKVHMSVDDAQQRVDIDTLCTMAKLPTMI